MKTNFKLLAMAAVAMLAMNSCEKENEMSTGEQKGTPVEFEMGINSITKTTTADNSYETTFAEDDEVGIFVYNGETLVTANAHYKLTDGKWVAQGEGIYAEEGVSYSYYAYYPYNADATEAASVSLSVATDQTAGYTGSDALMAKNESVAAGTTTVDLSYIHAFALVQVTLKGDQATKGSTVTLQNIYPTASLNLKTGEAGDASGALGTVAMKDCSAADATTYSYRAIVPAQTITTGNAILTISGDKNYKFTYSKDVPYESGKLRQYDITLGAQTGTSITIGNQTITDWQDGKPIEDGEGGVEEIVDPVTSLTLPINSEINFVKKGTWSAEKITGDELMWFHRENTSGDLTSPTIETVEGVSVIKLYNATERSSWNNSGIGCHYPGLFEKTTYKVTLTAQTDESTFTSNTNGGIIGITISNSNDTKMFKMINDKGADWSRNVTTFNQLNNTTWTTKTFYVDFNYASESGSASNLTEYAATTDEEVANGINISLYNYTATCPSSVYIKEVKIEKSALPESE